MDCEKFEACVIDELYDELDEITHAAARRHLDSCARCTAILSGLRATRSVAILPIEEPSDDLEARILAAADAAQRTVPWHRRALRAVAWAGSYAMRPQFAMAAVLVLILGSSLLLLRAKPGTAGLSPVRVSERGIPADEENEPAPSDAIPIGAAATEPAPQAEAEGARERQATDKAKGSDGKAALDDALAALDRSGCAAALDKLDRVGTEFAGQAAAASAMWEAAKCHQKMGEKGKAEELYQALKDSSTYGERAKEELAGLEQGAAANAATAQAAGGAGMPAAAAPARSQAKKAASQVAVDEQAPSGSPPGGAHAAPAPASPPAASPTAAAPENAAF